MFKKFILCIAILWFPCSHLFTQDPYIIVLLGPPGAGKGVIAHKLKQTSKLPYIQMTKFLSRLAKEEGELSAEIASYLSKGQTVSDEVILKTLLKCTEFDDYKKGFILNGFPKTLSQAKKLNETFPKKEQIIVINVALDDETILNRLQKKSEWHFGLDHHQKGNLQIDNNRDAIKKRLDIYRAQFTPVKEFYSKDFHWIEVSNDSFEECCDTIIGRINSINPQLLDAHFEN